MCSFLVSWERCYRSYLTTAREKVFDLWTSDRGVKPAELRQRECVNGFRHCNSDLSQDASHIWSVSDELLSLRVQVTLLGRLTNLASDADATSTVAAEK